MVANIPAPSYTALLCRAQSTCNCSSALRYLGWPKSSTNKETHWRLAWTDWIIRRGGQRKTPMVPKEGVKPRTRSELQPASRFYRLLGGHPTREAKRHRVKSDKCAGSVRRSRERPCKRSKQEIRVRRIYMA